MKDARKDAIVISYCVLQLLFFYGHAFAEADNKNAPSPIVHELKSLLDHRRPDLKNSLIRLIHASAQNKKSYWNKHNSLEEFYKFLDYWRSYTPERIAEAQEYSERFKSLYTRKDIENKPYYIDEGIEFVRDKDVMDWMHRYVRERGIFMDSKESAAVVNRWIDRGMIDMSSYEIPEGGFVSFNDFFTRKLKPGARPIANLHDDATLVCPADCRISPISYALTADRDFEVKGDTYNIAALLGSMELAKRFAGGAAIVCLLYPKDYHRFHAPVSGTIAAKGFLDDKHYYRGFKGLVKYFSEYHRAFYLINTNKSGQVGFVAIGMSDINSVNMTLPVAWNKPINKGDEIGYFAYGGSGIVMLFEPGILKKTLLTSSDNKVYRSASPVGATVIDDPAGAKLERVDASGKAAGMGLQKGDVVCRINGQAVNGAASFLAAMRIVPPRSSISMQILRDGEKATIDREAVSYVGSFAPMGTKIGVLNTR